MPLPSGHVVTADEFASTYNEDVFVNLGGSSITVSTTTSYADITSASKSWTKILGSSASDVIVTATLSGQSSATNTGVKIGVNINGTDTDVILFAFSSANVHHTLPTGYARISGLAAGTYTVKLRAKRTSGTGTFTIDANDTVSFRVEEKIL